MLPKESEALERFYLKYSKRLSAFITALVATYDDAQDILQSTFISALDSPEAYKVKASFLPGCVALPATELVTIFVPGVTGRIL